jgi:phytoene dehydrogenase-like protein
MDKSKTRLQHLKAAQKAGVKIKTAHPVVQVSVYDSVKGAKTIITAENV